MMDMRSPLNRARGLGSAKEGVGHFWMQRLTAVALAPLALWFAFSVVSLVGADHAAFSSWAGNFGNGLLLTLFIIAVYHHLQLGLQVVIEDYVHGEAAKITGLILVKLGCFGLGAASVLAVVRVSLGA
jgi:succinate dehydrogenase / fumarate reductase, membrane anchor subunit